ncbi:ATP-binding protein [Clostridium scatologenes]|uniref:ATPase associated with various cellular activities AAA_5 n=1 Tax=Clostridium scatologenes TaxID=1548 RepID=A0A0E3JP47_CLOSL|nr:ATP-binding protein [Clostridium scatologenes]AKA70017.1 ATPase associated with various cellular activities AAA_5 [Clostridium scatologenes]
MNFMDALLTVELVIKSDSVPLIIGESGIGKTALVKSLAQIHNYYSIGIDGNMLKEGEIGGLPTVEEYKVNVNGNIETRKKTVYAVHTKLLEIHNVLKKDPNKKILLFIDELNRCEHSVQQELMNIILNREINGYKLHNNVKVIAAMNPSNKYDNFANTDYQVVDMDPAQEDRFVWIEMEADARSWLQWGMEKNDKNGQTNIHEEVLEFIANFPDYLSTPNSKEYIKATPRSWERVSKAYRVYLNNKNKIPSRIFYNAVKGNLGASIAQDFYNYLENNKNPLIKPENIFMDENIGNELKERIESESHSRLYLVAKNALNYLNNKDHEKREIRLLSELLQCYPADLKMSIMQEIKWNYEDSLYKEFLEEPSFVEGYFDIYEMINA